MTENRLIIHCIDSQNMRFSCYNNIDTAAIDIDIDDLPSIVNRLQPVKTILYVPGELVTSTTANIPSQQRQKIVQMAPYALEEQLIEDVDKLHFAISRKSGPHGYSVLVVAHQLMQQWMEVFQNAGIKLDAIFPDYLGIPLVDNKPTVFYHQNKAYIRHDQSTGQVISDGLIKHSKIDIDAFEQLSIDETAEQSEEVTLFTTQSQMWLKGLDDLPAFNLLQGQYSKSEQIGRHFMVWRYAAALVLVWLTILFTVDYIEYQRLTSEDQYLQEQIISVYKDAFPQAKRIVNPRVQMEQYLKKLTSPASDVDFNQLLLDSAAVIKKVKNVEFKSIRYKRKRLEVELSLNSLAELDQIKQQLTSNGLNMSIQSANSKDGTVESRITIERRV